MAWAGTRKRGDPMLSSYAWRKLRAGYVKQLPLVCWRCGDPITVGHRNYPGTKITNLESLVLGHRVSRNQAKAYGWTAQQMNDTSNLAPEHFRCSSSSGSKEGNAMLKIKQQAKLKQQAQATSKPRASVDYNTPAAARDRW
jgi:hypothetical protein